MRARKPVERPCLVQVNKRKDQNHGNGIQVDSKDLMTKRVRRRSEELNMIKN